VLADAYRHCERLAREHYENFPVASRLLPRGMRPHIAAIYAFARGADDVADEGSRTPEERLRLLDDWGARLTAAAAGQPLPADAHEPVFAALAASMRTCRLPASLFEDLLSAFRQDVTTARYATWDDVLDYCRRSADPIGRLVLRVAGYDDPRLDRQSDAICTALQLTNFWQDLERDYAKGRVYVPRDISGHTDAREADLAERRLTPAWRGALADAAARTRALFAAGRPLCDAVRGRLRWELRATWLGGTRILERLEAAGFDVFNHRPSLSMGDAPLLLWRMATWPASKTTGDGGQGTRVEGRATRDAGRRTRD
jgi:hydroxysqualene synthase